MNEWKKKKRNDYNKIRSNGRKRRSINIKKWNGKSRKRIKNDKKY